MTTAPLRARSVALTALAAALTVAAAAVLGGCARTAHEARAAAPETVSVRVAPAGGAPGAELTLPGRVRAREEVAIAATTAARLTALPFAEGQRFARGQALARFEAPETRSALAAARAGVDAAEARHEQARLQEERIEKLFAAGVVPRRDLDVARSERRTAQAGEAGARAALEQWQASVSIQAPFAGVVVKHRVDPGVTVSPGQPLLDVRSSDAGEIETAVPESDVSRLAGARAWIQVGEGPWVEARLERLEGMTDFASRTRLAYLRPARAGVLEPGAYARVRFEGAVAPSAGALAVPAASVVRRGALAGVYVVKDGQARLRWLRLGRPAGTSVEVLAGLSPGEPVALDPAGLSDGRPVRVTR